MKLVYCKVCDNPKNRCRCSNYDKLPVKVTWIDMVLEEMYPNKKPEFADDDVVITIKEEE